MDVQTRLRIKR